MNMTFVRRNATETAIWTATDIETGKGTGTLMGTGAEQNEAGGNGDISTEP